MNGQDFVHAAVLGALVMVSHLLFFRDKGSGEAGPFTHILLYLFVYSGFQALIIIDDIYHKIFLSQQQEFH